MDYKSLASLALRLTGVIILALAVVAAPRNFVSLYLQNAGGGINTETWLLVTAASVFPALVGLLLIYFPDTVANRVVSAGDGDTADVSHLEQIAFSVLGLYYVSAAAFDGVNWYAKLRLYAVIFPTGLSDQGASLTNEDFAGIASTCTQFVVGVLLLLGGRSFANLLHRLAAQPKNVIFLIDSKGVNEAGQEVVKFAKRLGVKLRQSYERIVKIELIRRWRPRAPLRHQGTAQAKDPSRPRHPRHQMQDRRRPLSPDRRPHSPD